MNSSSGVVDQRSRSRDSCEVK